MQQVKINGAAHKVDADPQTPLPWVIAMSSVWCAARRAGNL
jgi:aerobic-type carbon monoxide dehydrogenase small subunit (CoxS/CutS family)